MRGTDGFRWGQIAGQMLSWQNGGGKNKGGRHRMPGNVRFLKNHSKGLTHALAEAGDEKARDLITFKLTCMEEHECYAFDCDGFGDEYFEIVPFSAKERHAGWEGPAVPAENGPVNLSKMLLKQDRPNREQKHTIYVRDRISISIDLDEKALMKLVRKSSESSAQCTLSRRASYAHGKHAKIASL